MEEFKFGEFEIATLEGLFEIDNSGIQYVYGSLFLTNKRLLLVSNQPLGFKESYSFWFKDKEIPNLDRKQLKVGNETICLRWIREEKLSRFYPLLDKIIRIYCK
ncbi:hypothetical protein [Fredinandcohnia quinoae]|uniref:Uncharacterized protein n=1 Tax=Fredinandcohnia quinoae TaxID=2918902 RepID=A0AAW5E9Z1_9BACI|nr:hypothetical protein [Fredinandcohnia sp. SECRCQ15]MCH1625938.1 hypothetical protein [Fredinandcohnia sp. SECRCQ15]